MPCWICSPLFKSLSFKRAELLSPGCLRHLLMQHLLPWVFYPANFFKPEICNKRRMGIRLPFYLSFRAGETGQEVYCQHPPVFLFRSGSAWRAMRDWELNSGWALEYKACTLVLLSVPQVSKYSPSSYWFRQMCFAAIFHHQFLEVKQLISSLCFRWNKDSTVKTSARDANWSH